MITIDDLLAQNKLWVGEKKAQDTEYFNKLSRAQEPHTLWIGCSDSRVSVNIITGTAPGEIFVHRNVANLIVNTDFNLLTVVEYAVDVLKVGQIVVCGHEQCGGIEAVLSQPDDFDFIFVGKWLKPIQDTYRIHKQEIDALDDMGQRVTRLAELNTLEQAHNLAQNYIVQRAWKKGSSLRIHGLMYCLREGTLRRVIELPD